MKKASLLIALLGMMHISFAQQRETALTTIGSMKVKINLNQATSLATITLMGPSTKWFSIGLSTSSMATNKDVITFGTTLLDQYFTSNGHVAPTTDATNNLTLVSNTVSGTTRTVVMTRPFSTGDAKDYTFTYAMTSLGIVWGVGPSTTVTAEHSTFGTKTLTFADVLANETFQLKDISVTPNPSSGIFNISKNDMVDIKTIRVYDANAKLIREISSFDTNNPSVDLTDLTNGLYFMEISNDSDSTVKKIVRN
ncbi:T9SS type A sorting domain-containing protein [Flavobacterium sp. CYK-55]|uniref:T9SS type A sorting domain-containing protein n=1 Tax=Flavobacterium sp. CYK-55 TaxID=2835529 RepID=UPI001BD1272F|nr:T9SS type A sorting domain-containing protein [Flavobacterium sp. CYK-55]MBS7786341.1 T9SS type A sorting domain-containing protein [Flavobacterium sp. CYK-55]